MSYDQNKNENTQPVQMEEITAKAMPGMPILLLNILAIVIFSVLFVVSIITLAKNEQANTAFLIALPIINGCIAFVVCPILFAGLKILKRNEAMVLTLFGRYVGTLRGEGFFFVNPFVTAITAPSFATTTGNHTPEKMPSSSNSAIDLHQLSSMMIPQKKISLKAMTLNNDKQKINDLLGNPIIIGIVVVWKVVNTAKAVFNVDNYTEFLSIQCDSALRSIVRLYPYDAADIDNEKSLRGSSLEISQKLKEEIQSKVTIAGLDIIEARITHLAYAPEIAASMLQRQQASAIIDARQMIVDGAVGMVEMALNKLSENNVVHLDEERKAAMVSNLLVVLCANKDAQPIVNSGSLY